MRPSRAATTTSWAVLAMTWSFSGCQDGPGGAGQQDGVSTGLESVQAALSTSDGGATAAAAGGGRAQAAAGKPALRTAWLVMKQQARVARGLTAPRDTRDWKTRGGNVVDTLTQTASTTQADLVSMLRSRQVTHKPFWIVNAIKVTADQAALDELGRRPDVAQVIPDRTFSLPPVTASTASVAATGLEWGLLNIRAPEVWQQVGAKGAGVVIANIDSGVQYDHPALVRQYRGNLGDGTFDHNYSWFDPARVCGEPTAPPCDNYSHGTHTMGTIVGDDGAGNQIGVAPGARWIAAKGCESNNCSTESLLAAGQWILAPTDVNGLSPRPELRPHIVNNSWGGAGGDPFFQAIVQAWVAAGIFPVFSVGNDGPFCFSAGSPGDYPESYAVGAYDAGNILAGFSARGPAFDGAVKPNISAPGVDVRSSVPGSSYAINSGTSMAAPHLAGAVALLWSAAPILLGDISATRQLLDQTALDAADIDCGGTDVNNSAFGEGRLDIARTIAEAPVGPTGTLRGSVTTSDGTPVSGAQVSVSGATTRSTMTDATGSYSLRLLEGTYQVRVTAFGFVPGVVTGLTVARDVVTRGDVGLAAAPAHVLSGTVRTSDGVAVPGARITIVNTPIPGAVADAAGRYSFSRVPDGEYDLGVTSDDGCLSPAAGHVVVAAADTTAHLTLARGTDGFGYFCRQVAAPYIPADTVLPLSGSGAAVNVPLPFTFNLYGQDYSSVNVTTAGFLTFLPIPIVPSDNYVTIPWSGEADAAVYPFWDALQVGPDASVRIKAMGAAPHRQFVVEWRGVTRLTDATPGGSPALTFEVVLFENGELRMSYQAADGSDAARGGSAAVGLEDETGTIGFQYSSNRPVLRSGLSVLYTFPPSGIVSGLVTSANTGAPLPSAELRALRGTTLVRSTKTNAVGRYSLRMPVGPHTLEVRASDHAVASAVASVADRGRLTRDFALRSGLPVLSPATIQLAVLPNQVRTRTLTLSNAGTAPLQFEALESGGTQQELVTTSRLPRSPSFQQTARTTRGLFASGVAVSGLRPMAVGDVLRSFTPADMTRAFGVGYTGRVWLNDTDTFRDVEFTTGGTPTGTAWSTPWAADVVADLAYDPGRGLLCHVNVGGDNGIHCTDPKNGSLVSKIVGDFPWTVASQRGLAYRPDDDSFYVGGWNNGIIYHVRGLGAAMPGEVIGSCQPADGTISGLAYNASMGVLWVATNTDTDTIYQLNPDDCTVLSTVAHPLPGYNGAGLDMDELGNLWTIAQYPLQAYLIDSGVAAFSDVSWLSITPAAGALSVGGKRNLVVKVDSTGLSPGLYLANVFVRSTPAAERLLRVPVSLVVSDYQQGVNVGGKAYVDPQGEPWAGDKAFVAGGWGYSQKGSTTTTNRTIRGTSDQPLFNSQRSEPCSYAFDKVPSGTYRVELGFAELLNAKVGARSFDVVIEDAEVLSAYDIASKVGGFTAQNFTFLVPITDGRLDVRLNPRRASQPPVLNSLRVTRLTDR